MLVLFGGRYWLDRQKGDLYLIPPGGATAVTAASVNLVVSVNATAINSTASNVHFENLQISHAQGNGMELRGSNIAVVNCTVSNHGAVGISIAGLHNRVQGSHVHDVGCAGVAVYSGARNASLIPGNAQILGNTVHANSLWKRMYQPAIAFDSVGDRFMDNTMYDGPHSGMLGHAVETTFSRNNFSESTPLPLPLPLPLPPPRRTRPKPPAFLMVDLIFSAQLSFAPRVAMPERGTPAAPGPIVAMSSSPTTSSAFETLGRRSRCKNKMCIVSTSTIRYPHAAAVIAVVIGSHVHCNNVLILWVLVPLM